MGLNFNPNIYREPEEDHSDRDFILQALSQLGNTAQTIGQNRRANDQAGFQARLGMAEAQDKYGSVGARKILRPTAPPRKILGQSSMVNGGQPFNASGEQPLESFDLDRPDQFAQARQLYGSNGVQPLLEARKYGQEVEDRSLSHRNIESEIAARDAKARALSQNGGKPPMGYRWNAAGDLEAIPGGPAYLKAGEKSGDMGAALNLYQTARQGLLDGLRSTNTGPIMGRLPAFTSGQQIAQGGVAAMAPVLKQLFRVAGEGVFTDRDQQLLLDMIPTRTSNPDAITTQMENIDRIVRAKLRMPQEGGGQSGGSSDPDEAASAARRARIAELRAKQRGR
jgi:hypothetical protein